MSAITRKYFNKTHYFLDYANQVVRLAPEFHTLLLNKKLPYNRGFKKVGGSSVGDVLVTDSFKSQFAAFCNIAQIGMPILDEKYVRAGIAIEPKVIDLIRKTSKKHVQTFPAAKYNYDYFAGKDEVIGGIPDGYIKETNMILEIKTTGEKNYEKWNTFGVPLGYKKQAAQYSYLMGAKKYAIVATFLKEEDYINPEAYPIEKRKTKNWIFDLDENEVKDDIEKIKKLYEEWTTTGISPKYNLLIDGDLVEWLACESEEEWKVLEAKWIAEKKYIP